MAERYEPRQVQGGMPAAVCEYGVVDMDTRKEICRAWTADGARKISNALNAAERRHRAAIAACLRGAGEGGE